MGGEGSCSALGTVVMGTAAGAAVPTNGEGQNSESACDRPSPVLLVGGFANYPSAASHASALPVRLMALASFEYGMTTEKFPHSYRGPPGPEGKPTANPAGSSANCRNDVAVGAVALDRSLLAHCATHLSCSSRTFREFARSSNPEAVTTSEMLMVDCGLDRSTVTDSQYGELVP